MVGGVGGAGILGRRDRVLKKVQRETDLQNEVAFEGLASWRFLGFIQVSSDLNLVSKQPFSKCPCWLACSLLISYMPPTWPSPSLYTRVSGVSSQPVGIWLQAPVAVSMSSAGPWVAESHGTKMWPPGPSAGAGGCAGSVPGLWVGRGTNI